MRLSFIITVLLLPLLPISLWAQEGKRPLSLENIQYLLEERVSPVRVAALIDEHGVSFEVSDEILEQLGNDAPELKRAVRTIQLRARELALEEERRKFEEARRRAAAEAKRQGEESQKQEEEKRVAAQAGAKPSMVKIPAGEFWMGCNEKVDTQCFGNEKPGRTVYVDAFQIDTTEVTVKAYRSCVESGKCSVKGLTKYGSCNWDKSGRGDDPINCVTWDQARTYCEAVDKRLPTQAEWEKAARGEEGLTYPWGNEWDKTKANTDEGGKGGTVAVASYASGVSPYGVHDMSGNVWEWVQDWYAADYYQKEPDRNPTGPTDGEYRSGRGGSWRHSQRNARVANRFGFIPGNANDGIGFRCASS